jgi:hypothetical protein
MNSNKATVKCRTPAKAQINYRKAQRTIMNRKIRRLESKNIKQIN